MQHRARIRTTNKVFPLDFAIIPVDIAILKQQPAKVPRKQTNDMNSTNTLPSDSLGTPLKCIFLRKKSCSNHHSYSVSI